MGVLRHRLVLMAAGLCLVVALATPSPAEARRYASIVVDVESGAWLHAENPERTVYPASLTKMMTLYMVFDALGSGKLTLGQKLKVSRHAAGMPPSKLGLRAGQRITVKSAILGLVTKSANDAAVVVAEALGGSEQEFAKMMTRKSRQLGLDRTTFKNASGLPNRGQVTTARDMARLALALLRNHPTYYKYFSTQEFKYEGKRYRNHNRLLRTYEGADGIKTGYIRASGFNLVASAVRKGRRLVGVVIGGKTAKSRNSHMVTLLNRAFKKAGPATAKAEPKESPQEAKAVPPPVPKPEDVGLEAEDTQIGNLAANVRRLADGEPIAPAPDLSPFMAAGREPGYAIQVGAYSRYDGARAAAAAAKGKLPKAFGSARVSVTELEQTKGVIYRARLTGLSREKANEACKVLVKKGLECLVVVEATTLALNPAE